MDLTAGIAVSEHFLPGEWNEVHPYVQYEPAWALPLGFGAFLNSEGKVSFYAGLKGSHGPFWAEIGLATGYSAADVVPWGRVGADLTKTNRIFLAPAYNADTGELGAVLGLEHDF